MAHHNSTPQSVLDAPVSRPEVIWPKPSKKGGWWRRATNDAGPYTSTKVRKIRKGRKARFNRSAA